MVCCCCRCSILTIVIVITLCVQASVLVAGLQAIFLYKEVSGLPRIVAFMACGVTLIIGAALLANFGQCKVTAT